MYKTIIKSFIKITILSLIFIVLFQIGNQVINAWWWSSEKKVENKDIFKSIDNYGFSEIGVALNINIGTKFYEGKKDTNNSLYNEIISISTIKSDRIQTNEVLIKKNLDAIKDYINIIKIDLKAYLDSQVDRQDSYESLINQLKLRYKTGYANSKNLDIQIDTIKSYIEQLDTSIDNTKQAIASNMKNYNTNGLSRNIDDFITLKNEYNLMRVYLIFCSRFQAYYIFLNNYNKDVITTLRLNKDAIIKNTHVVIPESGTNLINKLNLLYEEGNIPENLNINNNVNNLKENTVENSSFEYNIDTSINNNYNGIFGDPFNLQDNNKLNSIKQSGNINFGNIK